MSKPLQLLLICAAVAVTGALDLPPHASVLPPRSANLTVAAGFPLEVVRGELWGLDLEFTRHDIWDGLSAELISNRQFAVQPAGTQWPQPFPAGFPARWAALAGGAPPVVGGLSSAVSCTLSAATPLCGLVQVPVGAGWNAGMAFGSAIGVEAGRGYSEASGSLTEITPG